MDDGGFLFIERVQPAEGLAAALTMCRAWIELLASSAGFQAMKPPLKP